jgi:hypothetical protein
VADNAVTAWRLTSQAPVCDLLACRTWFVISVFSHRGELEKVRSPSARTDRSEYAG